MGYELQVDVLMIRIVVGAATSGVGRGLRLEKGPAVSRLLEGGHVRLK